MQAVVAIWSDRPRAFNDLHAHTIRLVAGLLSAALERASAFAANQLLLAERTASLAAIQAGEERFRTLVESIDDVVFRLDRDQRCVDIFGRWLRREGFQPADFLGRSTAEIVGPEGSAVHERANLRALAGETVTYEWTRQSRRGTRHMQTTLSPLRGARGEVAGIVGVGPRHHPADRGRAAGPAGAEDGGGGPVRRRRGPRPQQHDDDHPRLLRLPAGGARAGDDRRSADADEIRKAAERAMHLTRQLLGFGRQRRRRARGHEPERRWSRGMERMLRPLLGEDITLVTGLAPGLGGVEADYGQMEQVVMNLTLNARDAMRQGGQLTIETMDVDFPEGYAYRHLGLDIPAGPYVLLVVSDTGHGMTPEVKSHLFEPFFTTKPTTLNTGLGLATVYGIVVQSGGYIWVDTAPDQGAQLQDLPPAGRWPTTSRTRCRAGAGARAGHGDRPAGRGRGRGRGAGLPGARRAGYAVLEARNGREALASWTGPTTASSWS